MCLFDSNDSVLLFSENKYDDDDPWAIAILWHCLRDRMFSRFDTIPECDGQTDGHTTQHMIYRASIASRGKNWTDGVLAI